MKQQEIYIDGSKAKASLTLNLSEARNIKSKIAARDHVKRLLA